MIDVDQLTANLHIFNGATQMQLKGHVVVFGVRSPAGVLGDLALQSDADQGTSDVLSICNSAKLAAYIGATLFTERETAAILPHDHAH